MENKVGDKYLNTSHVTVNQIIIANLSYKDYNLNTSHVTVNRHSASYPISSNSNLNTSHVTVNHLTAGNIKVDILFKYISCYC